MFRLFVPQICIHCSEHIESPRGNDALSSYLCTPCLRSFRLLEPPSSADLHDKHYRFIHLDAVVELRAAYPFGGSDGIVQTLVHHAKYNSMMQLAQRLGEELAVTLQPQCLKSDLIVAVPLHRTRYAERGYNQAEKLAYGIARQTGIVVAPRSMLRRMKQTPTQTGLDHDEREENVRGAFVLGHNPHTWLRGKRVILVDDVMTTGATLASAAAELDRAKPKEIVVAAFSLALPG